VPIGTLACVEFLNLLFSRCKFNFIGFYHELEKTLWWKNIRTQKSVKKTGRLKTFRRNCMYLPQISNVLIHCSIVAETSLHAAF
jgi:hypothetical protein